MSETDTAYAFARIKELEVELYELRGRIVKADRVLEYAGYRHCDIPACNCNGYHPQGDSLISQLQAHQQALKEAKVALDNYDELGAYGIICEALGIPPQKSPQNPHSTVDKQ